MKKLFYSLILCSLFSGFLFTGCSSAPAFVQLNEVDAGFAGYTNNPKYDAVLETVTYTVTGKAQYDNLFKDAAKLLATVKQLNFALDKLGNSPQSLITKVKAAITNPLSLKNIERADDLKKDVEFYATSINFAVKALPAMKDRIASIASGLSGLNPQSDFSGLDAAKIPSVVSAIAETAGNLSSAGDEVAKLTTKLSKF